MPDITLSGERGKGMRTLVSDDDFETLAQHRWRLHKNGYVVRSGIRVNGKKVQVSMHRQVLGLARGDALQGDHINRNKLDNRRENLRRVTPAENLRNRSI